MDDAAPIFISYRRSDAAGHARALFEYLSGRFGDERIFFDRSTIEGGDVFPDTLRQGVEGCSVLLALIAPDWLEIKSSDGNRRLKDPADIVRQEIALALELGKKVIPVLFDDTPLPPTDHLPEPHDNTGQVRCADAARQDLRIRRPAARAGPAPCQGARRAGAVCGGRRGDRQAVSTNSCRPSSRRQPAAGSSSAPNSRERSTR